MKGSLGRATFTIPVGHSKPVKLTLNRGARKELAERGRLKVRIRTTVRLPDGRTVTSTRKLTLKGRR